MPRGPKKGWWQTLSPDVPDRVGSSDPSLLDMRGGLRARVRGSRPHSGRDEHFPVPIGRASARGVTASTKHRRTKPFTPRHNGTVEHYQRIMAEEVLYARLYDSEEERAAALATWNIHDNHHRPHSAAGGRPPASRLHVGVTNLQPSYN